MTHARSAVDICVDTCTDIFPGISHEHIRQLFIEHQGDTEQVTNAILESSNYPRQEEPTLSAAIVAPVLEDYTRIDRPALSRPLHKAVLEILKAEFPEIPGTYIKSVFDMKRQLYPAYLALQKAMRLPKAPYPRRRRRETVGTNWIAGELGEPDHMLRNELATAKETCLKQDAEEKNLEESKQEGKIQECSVCFDEYPLNRSVECNADISHFTCYDCTKAYIGSEIGQGTCNVTCPFGIDGKPCGAEFSDAALMAIDKPKMLKKLFHLKQQLEICKAGLEDLSECPFCDYKAVYPPVEENFEFQCQNPDCMLLSCRRCNMKSHIPLSCKDSSKDDALQKRHRIEEAMTEALVRTCNKCKTKFVKDIGCNKMTCKCGNTQCYVCGESAGYEHFGQGGTKSSKKCPLHDIDPEERHRKDVEKAEKEAREGVQKEFPQVAAEDLEIVMAEVTKIRPTPPYMRNGVPYMPAAGHVVAPVAPVNRVNLDEAYARIQQDRLRVAAEARQRAQPHNLIAALQLAGVKVQPEAHRLEHQGIIERRRQRDRDTGIADPLHPGRVPNPMVNAVQAGPLLMPRVNHNFAQFQHQPQPRPHFDEQQQQGGVVRHNDQQINLNRQEHIAEVPVQPLHREVENLRRRHEAITRQMELERDAHVQIGREAYAAWNGQRMLEGRAPIPQPYPHRGQEAQILQR